MLYYSLILIFYLLFTWLARRNIRYGLYLILLFLPAYQIRYQVLGIPATLLEGMIWLLFGIWIIKLKKEKGLTFNPLTWIKNLIRDTRYAIRDKQNLIPRELRLPIILLLTAATISVFTSPNLPAALGIWKAYFIEALLFFIIFVYNIKTLAQIKWIIRTLGALTIAIGIFAIYQKLTGAFIPNPFWAEEATRRVTTFFSYPNANALFLVPVIFLTIGNLLTDKKPIFQSFNLLILALSWLTILWTKSAGALLALTVGLVCLLIFYKKTRLATLVVLLFMSVALFFIPAVKQNIQRVYISTNEIHLSDKPSDIQLRVQMWRETMKMLKDRPIFGAGLAGYQTLVAPYHQNQHLEIFLYPHNFFLNFWTETGLLGLIAIIWIITIFFILGFQTTNNKPPTTNHQQQTTNKTLTFCALCAMIALIVQGLVDTPYFKNDLATLFWIIVGLIIILHNNWRRARVVESDSLENC